MSELKDLAATIAANEPQSPVAGNVTESTSTEVLSVEAITKNICKDGFSHVVKASITNIDCTTRTAKNGNEYLNAFITLDRGIKGAQSMPDGSHRIGLLGAIQTPFSQILLVMRKDRFYGRFVNYVGEAAELNMASMYLAGVQVSILCQFVPAGVQERNPFTRKENLYNVVDYDRYIHHIVGVESPTDPVTTNAYQALIKQIMDDARAAIIAKRDAKAKASAFVEVAMQATDDVPF